MRVALAQLNPTVGDIEGNLEKHLRALDAARSAGARLVIFPELSLLGYPPKDLLLKPGVIADASAALERLARACTDVRAIAGCPTPTGSERGEGLYNAAALLRDGAVASWHPKRLLPSYDVFDEKRYFEPGGRGEPVVVDGWRLGVTVCEDLWNDERVAAAPYYHAEPVAELAEQGVDAFVNCSASPFVAQKHAYRGRLFQNAARRHGVPLLFCNQVGGNDELVFDGASCALDAEGELTGQALSFEEDLLLVDLPPRKGATRYEPVPERVASVYHGLVRGLKDYCAKCGFERVVLGLSGGIDSAVSAALCVAALGPEQVRGVTMPSRYSSEGSVRDSEALADNLGIGLNTIPIAPAHEAFESMLGPVFEGLAPDVTEENLQARIRGVITMSISNKFRSLLVSTGNKSELAVGYCTLYGDMAGGLAVLSDVPKTLVYELAEWINAHADLPRGSAGHAIPPATIEKPPSAELRPDQKDSDSLPDYPVLDRIIEAYVERHQSADRITAETGFDAETVRRVVRLIDGNEYKRKQAAPGLKVTARAFGFGRRMPIAQRYQEPGFFGKNPG